MEIGEAVSEIKSNKGKLFLCELGNTQLRFYMAKSLDSLKARLETKYRNLNHGQGWIWEIGENGERTFQSAILFNCEAACTASEMGLVVHRGKHHLMGEGAEWKRQPHHGDNEFQYEMAKWLKWFEQGYKKDYREQG